MDMEILDGLRKVVDGTTEMLNGVNPMVDSFKEEEHGAMVDCLLDAGFTEKQITSFVDVNRVQYLDYIALELKFRNKMAAKTKKP